MTDNLVTRRNALIGAGGLAAGVPLLAACGGSGGSGSAGPTGSGPLVATSGVPVGGGVILSDRGVVVTQPSAGHFKVFSDVCTHMGCILSQVAGGTINCGCHGSKFNITDGSVAQGPASAPLPEFAAKVQGGQVVAATSSHS